MATANLTEDGKQKTIDHIFSSASLNAEKQLTFISVLNFFLSITTFVGNALILVALRKESSLHPPSKLLLLSLAATDLCVGLISEPLAVTCWMSIVHERWAVCHYASLAGLITGRILIGVSQLTLTAISVDRLLALFLGLRYRHVVTFKRTCVVVVIFWVVSTVFTTLTFWNSLLTRWYNTIVASLCVITSILSYTKIFLTLRQHQTQVHVQQQGRENPLNIERYRKAVSSALLLQLTLAACYLPHIILGALTTNNYGMSSSCFLASQYTITLVFLNSSLNPILYCWKIEEVKQAVKKTIRQAVRCLISS